MLGKIVIEGEEEPSFFDPNKVNLVDRVSIKVRGTREGGGLFLQTT